MSQSIILIPVPSADPIVGEWRKKYDEVALHGIPSHITLLFPFKESSQISQEIIQRLEILFSNIKQFSFTLEKINTFPNVIFLEPNPRNTFIKLTETIVHNFPDNLPYEGKYPSINPHLTIGGLSEEQKIHSLREEIARDISSALPIKTRAREAWLMVKDENGEWHIQTKFPFFS
jgi:2'-5' RNA ligase